MSLSDLSRRMPAVAWTALLLLLLVGCSSSGSGDDGDGCTSDADCADKGEGYVCDTASGRCVLQAEDGDMDAPDGDADDADGDVNEFDGEKDGDLPDGDGEEVEREEEFTGDPKLSAPESVEIPAEFGVTHSIRVTLRNVGGATLAITDIALVQSTPGFVLENLPAFTAELPSGESLDFLVSYTAASTEPAAETLRILSNDSAGDRLDIPVSAAEVGAPSLRATPPQMNFGLVGVDESEEAPLSISNQTSGSGVTASLVISDIRIEPPESVFFSLTETFSPLTLPPGQSRDIGVLCTPDATVEATAQIKITHNDTNVPNPATISLLCTGGLAVLEISPDEIAFGRVTYNTRATATVQLRNAGSVPVVLEEIELSDNTSDEIGLYHPPAPGTEIPAGWTEELVVEFIPTDSEEESATLTITSNDREYPIQEVPVSGQGVLSQIEVDPAVHDFGEVLLNSQENVTVTLRNVGEDVIEIYDALREEYNNDFRLPVDPFPATLEAEEELSFDIAYQPSALGADAEVFNFQISGSLSSPSITVTGEGARPELALQFTDGSSFSGAVAFGVLRANHEKSIGLRISNPGNYPLQVEQLVFDPGASTQFDIQNSGPFEIPKQSYEVVTFRFAPARIFPDSAHAV